jgi:hypothetical protein
MSFNCPAISLVGIPDDILTSGSIALEKILEPSQASPTKLTTVGVEQCAAVADGNISFPRRSISRESLKVSFALLP